MTTVPALREVTSGLRFPEGPVALPDGSVLVVEIEARTLTRVAPDGRKTVVSQHTGGPNGAAMGPDGKVYICNNGGFSWHEDAQVRPAADRAGRGLLGRPHRARRSRHRRHRDPLHALRRAHAARAQRPGVRRARRLLFHRPRQDAGARDGSRRGLLRQGRRQPDQGGRQPDRQRQRLRAVAGRQEALLRRDGSRRACGRWTSWRPARCGASRGPLRTAVACWAGPAASTTASTAWRWTAPATSASPR